MSRAANMRATLAPMTRSAALGYGRRIFHGPAFDKAFVGMLHRPDGTPPDITQAAQGLIEWLDEVRAFAKIVRDKPEDPPKVVPYKPLKDGF